MIVDSRVFVSNKMTLKRCIPMLDMGNDMESPNAVRVTLDGNNESIVATKDIKKGQEIGWSYLGPFSLASILFQKYGFVRNTLKNYHISV